MSEGVSGKHKSDLKRDFTHYIIYQGQMIPALTILLDSNPAQSDKTQQPHIAKNFFLDQTTYFIIEHVFELFTQSAPDM